MNKKLIVSVFLLWFLLNIAGAEGGRMYADKEGNISGKTKIIKLTPVHVIQSDVFMNTPEEIIIENDRMFISLRGAPEDNNEYVRVHSGITFWDIRQIENPKLLSEFSHPALQGGMDHIRLGKILFLQSLYNATLFGIDITDITAPQLLDTLNLGKNKAIAYRLCKIPNQNKLVVSIRHKQPSLTGEVAIIDISDPKNLRVTDKQIEADTWSYDNFARGNAVYSFPYLNGNKKLNIYKIEPNGKIHFQKSLVNPLLDGVHYFQENNFLIVANFETTAILTLNIRDPFNPQVVGQLRDKRLGNPNRIAPDYLHKLLWVAGFRENIISVVDISNPQHLIFIKSFKHLLFDCVQTVAFYKNHLFVGSRNTNSIVIFRVEISE